jgi:hypothetical protein
MIKEFSRRTFAGTRMALSFPKCNMVPGALVLCFGLSAAALLPQAARAAMVHFESANDLLDFNQVTSANGVSINFVHSATAGNGGSGGLVHAATAPEDTTAIYTPVTFDLTGGAMHTLSIDFKTGPGAISGSANAIVMLGVSANNNTGFYSNAADAFIGSRVRRRSSSGGAEGLQSQTKIASGSAVSAPADGSLADINFASDNWYRFSVSLTRDAIVNQFSYESTLEDLGPTGTGLPVAVTNGTLAGTFLNSSLYNDTAVYAAFRGVPAITNGNVALDNFTVTVVPEPAGALLFGLGMLGLLVSRRHPS